MLRASPVANTEYLSSVLHMWEKRTYYEEIGKLSKMNFKMRQRHKQ